MSLSCRNKTLTEDEREFFKCGRSEMFSKQQIRHDDWNSFLKHVKRFEVRKDAYLTKSGQTYPQKALVVYWNICPIDAYKAMKDQMSYLTEVLTSLTDSALKNSQGGIDEAYYKVRKSFDTCQSLFARNFGEKHWVDIDCDIENASDSDYHNIRLVMDKEFSPGDVMYILTAGGIHCMIRRTAIRNNPVLLCEQIDKAVKAKEIIRNRNEMVALPGTFQYENHIVRVINKKDFTESMKLHDDG